MIKTIHDRLWYCCPHCGKALFPVRADTKINNMPFRCKACKHDLEVNIALSQEPLSQEPLTT